MDRDISREDCEQISVVLEIRGNAAQRREVRRMVKETMWAVRQTGADVRSSVMMKTEKDIFFNQMDSGE